jgi:hypothetical protein
MPKVPWVVRRAQKGFINPVPIPRIARSAKRQHTKQAIPTQQQRVIFVRKVLVIAAAQRCVPPVFQEGIKSQIQDLPALNVWHAQTDVTPTRPKPWIVKGVRKGNMEMPIVPIH